MPRARWAADGVAERPVLVEALITDAGAATRPDLVIPRDIKVFAVAGQVGFVEVLDRNGPGRKRGMAVFDHLGRRLPATTPKWPPLPETAPPPGFAATIRAAKALSAHLPQLLRLDFYATLGGPLLGEVTGHPSAGLDITPFSRRTQLQMWELAPD